MAAPFLATSSHKMPIGDIMTLLDLHLRVNDVVCSLGWVHTRCFELHEGVATLRQMAAALKALTESLIAVKPAVTAAAKTLSAAPLLQSPHFFQQWVESAGEYQRCVQEHILARVTKELDEASKAADANSPKYNTCITKDSMNLEVAVVLFVGNPQMKKLPRLLQKLWDAINQARTICILLGLGSITQCPATKDWVEIAFHALTFGKTCVRVAAAIQTLVDKNAHDVPKLLQQRANFPESLAVALETLQAGGDAQPTGLQKRCKPESGSGASASGIKRLKSASILEDGTASIASTATAVKQPPRKGAVQEHAGSSATATVKAEPSARRAAARIPKRG